jgi:hypothetical protein
MSEAKEPYWWPPPVGSILADELGRRWKVGFVTSTGNTLRIDAMVDHPSWDVPAPEDHVSKEDINGSSFYLDRNFPYLDKWEMI